MFLTLISNVQCEYWWRSTVKNDFFSDGSYVCLMKWKFSESNLTEHQSYKKLLEIVEPDWHGLPNPRKNETSDVILIRYDCVYSRFDNQGSRWEHCDGIWQWEDVPLVYKFGLIMIRKSSRGHRTYVLKAATEGVLSTQLKKVWTKSVKYDVADPPSDRLMSSRRPPFDAL